MNPFRLVLKFFATVVILAVVFSNVASFRNDLRSDGSQQSNAGWQSQAANDPDALTMW
jgi:hypothetical protein